MSDTNEPQAPLPQAPSPERHHARWEEREKEILREHWPHLPTAEVRRALPGRSHRSVTAMAVKLGLKKSPERLREMGLDYTRKRWGK